MDATKKNRFALMRDQDAGKGLVRVIPSLLAAGREPKATRNPLFPWRFSKKQIPRPPRRARDDNRQTFRRLFRRADGLCRKCPSTGGWRRAYIFVWWKATYGRAGPESRGGRRRRPADGCQTPGAAGADANPNPCWPDEHTS